MAFRIYDLAVTDTIANEKTVTKTESAYRLLRLEILRARLLPGTPLKLEALRGAYGLGWTPLREALSRLEAEGLVRAISNRGFVVAPVSQPELEDLTRARLVVELPLLEEAIAQGGSDWEDRIVTAHYRLSRANVDPANTSEVEIDEWEEKHEAFHSALIGAASSTWLLRFRSQISDQLHRHHRVLSLGPTLRARQSDRRDDETIAALREAMAIDNHTGLMKAVLDRDATLAQRLMVDHIGYTLNVFSRAEGQNR